MKLEGPQDRLRPNRRQLQAAQTRREIIMAATRLFTEQGYARTSVTDIAREAGVAVQTIYSSLGSKAQIITAMVDEVDLIAGIPELNDQAMRATDPNEVIAIAVRLTRQLNERCQDILAGLRSAAQVDEEIASAYARGNARHAAGARQFTERLAALGALRPGLDTENAAASLSVLLSTDVWVQLRTDHRWTFDRSESWLVATLRALLLP
jgi:AcrR family transcriptional regulator